MALTQERLKERLKYDELSGTFTWIHPAKGIVAGSIAGGPNLKGHWTIGFDGRRYFAHILAWLYLYGEFPDRHIDHIDGDGTNNRQSNLRLATVSQNIANSKAQAGRSSSFKGVTWCKRTGKWMAQIKKNYKNIGLGRYGTEEEAHAAYVAAASELFGEFARVK